MRIRRPSKALAAKVAARANGYCEYCASPVTVSLSSFCADHVYPYSLGGETDLANLAYACQGCNSFKHLNLHARDLYTGRFVPLFNPRLMKWTEHFEWTDDYLRMVGITAIGRATVSRLQLNREAVCNVRRLLHLVRLHPPLQFTQQPRTDDTAIV